MMGYGYNALGFITWAVLLVDAVLIGIWLFKRIASDKEK